MKELTLVEFVGIEEIKQHQFFKNINWSTLYLETRTNTFVPVIDTKYNTDYFTPRSGVTDSLADPEEETKTEAEGTDQFAGWTFARKNSIS
jgi:hypothetical protein